MIRVNSKYLLRLTDEQMSIVTQGPNSPFFESKLLELYLATNGSNLQGFIPGIHGSYLGISRRRPPRVLNDGSNLGRDETEASKMVCYEI